MQFEFDVDSEIEEKGEWQKLDSLPGEIEVLVRSTNCADWRRAQAKIQIELAKIAKQAVADGKPEPEIYEDPIEYESGQRRLYSKHLLLDVKGLKDFSKKPPAEVKFTDALGLELMTEPDHRRFAAGVVVACSKVGEREEGWLEEAAKNSEPESESIAKSRTSKKTR